MSTIQNITNLEQESSNKPVTHGDLFPLKQIKLSELSVFNWGSFNSLHTAPIDSHGTLVIGDNGSGKSTLIDGLMALLLPPGRVTFNIAAAQGDRSDRTLISYMRGSFGAAHDGSGTRVKSKRESAVVTGLRALYRGDDDSIITLAALFWTTQSSNSLADVKRIYVVAKRNLTLNEMLDAFKDGDARALKRWLKDDPAITCCNDSFSDYQELYRKLLYMENKNAPILLSRALGLKKIDNLTSLIRELVLEPSTIREDAQKVIDEFADLVAIHSELTNTRAQINHLSKLPELDKKIKTAKLNIIRLQQERDGLPVYMGEIEHRLWSEKIKLIQDEIESLSFSIKQISQKVSDTQQLVNGRHEDYIKAGGGRIESLKKEQNNGQDKLLSVTRQSSQYQADVRALELNDALLEIQFNNNQSNVDEKLSSIKKNTRECQNKFGEVTADFNKLQNQHKSLCNEISEMERRPDSNISIKYQQLREELVKSLGLERSQCVFIGELIDIHEDQRTWQGAIERALGELRITLIVPENYFPKITQWLNKHHTGLHVRVQFVDNIKTTQYNEFKNNGYLKKLIWRDHPYRNWLEQYLNEVDLECVQSTDRLDKTPRSITEQGLIHKNNGYLEKNDLYEIDNHRYWYLGFSNKARLAVLQNDKSSILKDITKTKHILEITRKNLDEIGKRDVLLNKLLNYQWDEINLPYWQSKVAQLQKELKLLENTGNDLEKAKNRWLSAMNLLEEIRVKKESYIKKDGELSSSMNDAQSKQKHAAKIAKSELTDSTRAHLKLRVDDLVMNDLDKINSLLNQYDKDIEQMMETWRNKNNSSEKSAISIMSTYRSHEKWQVNAIDWGTDVSSIEDYILRFQHLNEEGLPLLVEKYVERMNKNTTQSLARIRHRLDSERDDILERIDTINNVLKKTEFGQGTYLKLDIETEKYPHVIEFNKQVFKVLNHATSNDHEARYKQLVLVIDILKKASNQNTAGSLESLRLLDPRYQMSFRANVLDTITGESRDVLGSSSRKSGGEQESFTVTVLAASLAYVLTPKGYDQPVYSTVFLDEAFSNTAEAASSRVLRVFKELNIHVNLITPYKNLNIARESARSLLIVERDQDNHDSRLCEVTWEQLDNIHTDNIEQLKKLENNFEIKIATKKDDEND